MPSLFGANLWFIPISEGWVGAPWYLIYTRFYILIQILILSHEVTNKFPGSELIYAHVNNICAHNKQLCIQEFKCYFLLKVVIVWLFVDSFDFWHHHQLYCKMAIISFWAETLLGNYISCADVGVVKLNCFDLLFFKTNLTLPLYILFNLLVHLREFHLGDRGVQEKNWFACMGNFLCNVKSHGYA